MVELTNRGGHTHMAHAHVVFLEGFPPNTATMSNHIEVIGYNTGNQMKI